jgi:hypothetical protein
MLLRLAPSLGTRRLAVLACLASLSLGLAACGHPASKEECQEIFDRSAAIELGTQKVTDPALVRERTDEARASQGEDLLKQCVGRRITDRAMRCVRKATTARELEACLM